ncbi:hypothetical protein [Humidisolicoccus flavus]|uniref:hypothetical protein n=1 Tax=Humidisolicoccus flavus TaxID=3111414 RepID=UPI003253F2F8
MNFTAIEYVDESAQVYLDLQAGVTFSIVMTIILALLPLALAIWSFIKRSFVLAGIGVVGVIAVIAIGITFAVGYANRSDVEVSEIELTGAITAIESDPHRAISTVRLDTQNRSLLVTAGREDINVGETLTVTCATIDGAVALYTPCTIIEQIEAP